MKHPHEFDDTVKRRTVLGVAASGLAALVGYAPVAHHRAVLDATVTPVAYATGSFGDVAALEFRLENTSDEPIQPVATLWGVARRTQHPWNIVSGPSETAVGATARYRITAPGDSQGVRVHLDKPAQLTVYDRGREARAVSQFVPSTINREHTEDHGVR